MTKLRDLVYSLLETCKERLVKQLMYLEEEEQLLGLELSRLYDNPAELVEGWSFFDDARNVSTFPYNEREGWLWDRILSEAHIRDQLLQKNQAR